MYWTFHHLLVVLDHGHHLPLCLSAVGTIHSHVGLELEGGVPVPVNVIDPVGLVVVPAVTGSAATGSHC